MYLKHKRIIISNFIIIAVIAYKLNIDFQIIASEVISIISIALAVYAIAISCLIGSPLSSEMDSTPDYKLKYKSQLGVIKTYIMYAMATAIITLILSCVIKLLAEIINDTSLWFFIKIISAISLGLFSVDFIFIWIIFLFILNREMINKNKIN